METPAIPAKIGRLQAYKARLQTSEEERARLLQMVMKSQVNLARIAERIDYVQNDINIVSRELKLLEMAEPEQKTAVS